MFGVIEGMYASVLVQAAMAQAEQERIEKNRQAMPPEEFAEWLRKHNEMKRIQSEYSRREYRRSLTAEAQKPSNDSTGAFALGVIFGSMF